MKTTVLFFITVSLRLSVFILAKNVSYQLGTFQEAPVGSEVCMPELGCFAITKDFFHPLFRPINFLPQDRVTIDTQFHLYTKEHPVEYQLIKHNDTKSLNEVDKRPRTVFIIHGFIDSKYYGKWMEDLKNQILLHSDFNVIIVDWSHGNGAPYTKASANTRVVGAEVALLIQALIKYRQLDLMKVHIIGHSLGAHIAGYAGERLKKLGRITGLDPAAPYFQRMPPSIRLDPTDADFVDIIHTDSSAVMLLALGMMQECGHVDFYPNNGMRQPGCRSQVIHSIFLEGLIDASRRFVSCNHQRAVDFFTYSVNYKRAPPVGFQCASYMDYLNGQCADCSKKRCAVMGIHAEKYRPFKNDSQSIKMFLATGEKAPFWEFTFQITIKLFNPKSGNQDRKGSIQLQIEGTQNTYKADFASKDLVHGATYTHLIREPQDKPLGQIKGLTFTWASSSFSFFSKHLLYLEYIIVKPMNYGDEVQQKQMTKKFCNKGLTPVKSKSEVRLTAC